MKKVIILVLSIIALILTFVFSEIFSIYHFGTMPTLLTSLYLISIFSIFEYLSISITYIFRNLLKKEKIGIKKNYRIDNIVYSFITGIIIFYYC